MRTCSNCGAEVPDTAKFCRTCGANLADSEDVTVILDGGSQGPADHPAGAIPVIPPAKPFDADRGSSREENAGGYQGDGYGGYSETGADGSRQRGGYPGGGYQGGGYQGGGYQGGGYQGGGRGGYPGGGARSYAPPAQAPNWDHTREFDAKDVSENKAVAMLVYLMGFIGIIIALLAGTTSPYAAFHVRQGLKFVVLDTLIVIVGVVFLLIMMPFTAGSLIGSLNSGMMSGNFDLGGTAALGAFTTIIYAALGIFSLILGIVKIICFFSICKGEAKEPPIVRAFGFLR